MLEDYATSTNAQADIAEFERKMRSTKSPRTDEDTRIWATRVKEGKFRPMGNRVVFIRDTGHPSRIENGVRIYESNGIVLPDAYGDWSNFGTIIAVGPDCVDIRQEHLLWHAFWPEWDAELQWVGGEVFIAPETLCELLIQD